LEPAVADLLYQRYEQDVFRNTTPEAYFDRIVTLPMADSENFQKALWLKETLTRFWPVRDLSSLRILDVGCGGGTLLYTLREVLSGGALHGIELNSAYADLARRRLNADIRNEPGRPGLFDCQFDLVVSAKVLEHVDDPEGMIRSMAEDLAPDGLMFLEVPDILDIYTLPHSHERFWIPHIWYFSRATLGALVARSGLEVIKARSIVAKRGRSYLQMLVQKGMVADLPVKPFDDPSDLLCRVGSQHR
jgi:SAM-dependent methyltransferase